MQEILSFLKYLAQSNTINFIIMLIILVYIAQKMNLKTSLENSVKNVETEIQKSDEEKEKSEEIFADSQKAMKKLPQEIDKLEKEAVSKANIFKCEIEQSTLKNIQSIEQNVQKSLTIEEEKFSNLLKDQTVIASVEKAKAGIIKQLEENPDLHAKFIAESLDELDRAKL